jgi:hypothetical protein
MDFVGASYTTCIPIIGVAENFESLVYEDVMYKKVGDTIGQNSKTKRVSIPKSVCPSVKQGHTYNGVKNKESIVPFKPGIMVFMMVVLMQ